MPPVEAVCEVVGDQNGFWVTELWLWSLEGRAGRDLRAVAFPSCLGLELKGNSQHSSTRVAFLGA